MVVAAYDFLTGRRFWLDARDRLRLATRSLAAWDATWVGNPRRSDLVVCLTTTPSRLPRLGPTLASLCYQTRAARIRLHLPDRSVREDRGYRVPGWLGSLAAIEIVRCEDQGPATKLLPALQALDGDAPILVVDDDMIYPPDLVAWMHALSRIHPDRVLASSGWRMPSDLVDRPTTLRSNLLHLPPTPVKCTRVGEPYRVDVVQGYSGYLVRPRFFDAAVHDYSRAPREAFFVDDVWLSAHCLVPRYVHPGPRYCFPRWPGQARLDRRRLGRLNQGPGGDELRHNTIVMQHLRSRWR